MIYKNTNRSNEYHIVGSIGHDNEEAQQNSRINPININKQTFPKHPI